MLGLLMGHMSRVRAAFTGISTVLSDDDFWSNTCWNG